jgi:hypothetical protein
MAGAALALTLAAPLLAVGAKRLDWAVDGGFALLLSAGAIGLSHRVAERRASVALAAWIGAAAGAAALALHAGVDVHLSPIAYAVMGLVLSALAVRLAWRGFADATAVTGLASLAALLAAPFVGGALMGHSSWTQIAGVATTAWRRRRRRSRPAPGGFCGDGGSSPASSKRCRRWP